MQSPYTKNHSRFLSFILAVALIMGVIIAAPVSASALDNGDFSYRVLDNNKVEITGCVNAEDFEWLSIPDAIDNMPVVGIAAEAFSGMGGTDMNHLPANLEYIGERAFYGVTFYESLTVPDSLVSIGDQAIGFGPEERKYFTGYIFGAAGSAAQTYCENNGLRFVDIEKQKDPDFSTSIYLMKISDKGASYDEYGPDRETYFILENLTLGNNIPEGVSFDLQNFMITFDGFKRSDLRLVFFSSGTRSLTISVNGECELGAISMYGERNPVKARFDGSGVLTVNENKVVDNALTVNGITEAPDNDRSPQISFSSGVQLKFFGRESAMKVRSLDKDTDPFIVDGGSKLNTRVNDMVEESGRFIDGYIDAGSIYEGKYPANLGDLINNDDDPDGIYAAKLNDDNQLMVYKYCYDKKYDLYLFDNSYMPVAYDKTKHHYVLDAYNRHTELRSYEIECIELYSLARAIDGNVYLARTENFKDINDWVSMSCDAHAFEYICNGGYDYDNRRYAVTTDTVHVTFSGAQDGNVPAEILGEVSLVTIRDSSIEHMGFKAISKSDPDGIYIYHRYEPYDDSTPDEAPAVTYEVYRYTYAASIGHYFVDYDFDDLWEELSEEEFLSKYTPVFNDKDERVEMNNTKVKWCGGNVYSDPDGKEYACRTIYDEETESDIITDVYNFALIPELSDGEEYHTYYFTPAEDVDPAALTQVKDVYHYPLCEWTTVENDFFYNIPDHETILDTVDVGNVWNFNLISNNPMCPGPLYIPFIGEVHEDIVGAYCYDEIWTNTVDGSTSSKLNEQPLKPGCKYDYTMVVKAMSGYKFSDDLNFTYTGEACPTAKLTLSEDKRTLTIEGLESVTFMLDTPSGLKAVGGDNGVNLSYNAVKGASKYRIFRKMSGGKFAKVGDTTSTTFTDKTAVSGKTYYYTVRCLSADGSRFESDYDTDGVSVTYYAPAKITALTNDYKGVKITIDRSVNAFKYRVFKKVSGKWTKLIDTSSATIIDTKAQPGKANTYTVRAMDRDDHFISGYNTTGWTITYIPAPKITGFENLAKGTRIKWSSSTGAAKYILYIKSGSSWKQIAKTAACSYVYNNLKASTTYTYTVRAVDKSGKVLSGFNTTGWKNTFIAPPALPKLTNTKNGIQLTLTQSKGAVRYRIFRKVGSGKWVKLADTKALKYLDKLTKNGIKYTYTVRCISADGKSFTSAYNTTGRAIICKR